MSSNNKVVASSAIKDNYSSNSSTTANREPLHTDKSSLITSLNYNLNHLSNGNNSSSSSSNNNHLYQNVSSNFKQIQNLLQQGGAVSGLANKMVPPVQPPPVMSNNHHNHQQPPAIPSTPVPSVNTVSSTSNGVDSASSNGFKSTALAKSKTLDGYVGFANLPNQVYRKAVKKGFEFNLMVIGESGLGKSTFINSLFLSELYNPQEHPCTYERRTKKTTTVDSTTVMLSEKGVNLRLTVIDTPGFGESIDNTNCWQPIIDYIDTKYEEFLSAESSISRKLPITDNRVHCCLHFIAPGHTLKQLDIEVMKRLHDRVNLIPVIAKADMMTLEEIKEFKANVLKVINENKLQIYEFPDIDDDDVENNRTNSIFKSKLPFAIVGSNTLIDVDGKQVRGRQYPWGVVNVDDQGHCDFMALRTMLIRTHMQDLKDVTNNVHYENYRFKKLAYVTGDKAKPINKSPFQQLEEERKESEAKLENMKIEMEGVFNVKVKEKISRLKESEQNV